MTTDVPTDAAGDLRAALASIARWPETASGRPAFTTRKRRPFAERPRIAGRFVPKASYATILDWNLSPAARLLLLFLLGCPREGLLVHDQSRGGIAKQFGVAPRSVGNWLHALQETGWLHLMPGKRRGLFVALLSPTALRFLRYSAADLIHLENAKSRLNQRAADRSGKNSSPLKAEETRKKEETPLSNKIVDPAAPANPPPAAEPPAAPVTATQPPPAPAATPAPAIDPVAAKRAWEQFAAERARWREERARKEALARRFRSPFG